MAKTKITLFTKADVESTPRVARATGISEARARKGAEQIGVRRIGRSYAWTPSDVEALVDLVDDEDANTEEDDDEGGGDDDE